MRINRLLSPDTSLTAGARFAGVLRADGSPGPASPAQISRWETGAAPIGYEVIRRYERALRLPDHNLLVVAEVIARETPGADARAYSRLLDPGDPATAAETSRLLDRALSAEPMDGLAWNTLTAHLAAHPAMFLHPNRLWDDLAQRLLTELAVASGLAWVHRNEAANRLLQHPRGHPAAIAAAAALAADPAHQTRVEPLSLLDSTPHPDAARHLLDQLANPTSERAVSGALIAVIGKIGRRQLGPDTARLLLGRVAALAESEHASGTVRQLMGLLLRELPPTFTGGTVSHLRRVIGVERVAAPGGRPAAPAVEGVTRRLAADITARLHLDLPAVDHVLPALLADLLFNPDPTHRLHAGLLIGATPYAGPAAEALNRELATSWGRTDTSYAVSLLGALTALPQPTVRAVVERLVVAPDAPAVVREAAARAVGFLPGRSTDEYWRTAVGMHLRDWQRSGSEGSLAVLRRMVYAIGVARRSTILAELAAAADVPAAIRASATWWAGHTPVSA